MHTPWFAQSATAFESIMGLNIWTTSGTIMLFYLATLQSIPTDVYEAAAIDGTSRWRTFWKITFPLLKPGHFFVAVLSIIGCLKVFDQVFIVSGGKGGPAYSTETAVLYLYQTRSTTCAGATPRPRRRPVRDHLPDHPCAAAAVRPRRDRLLMAMDREAALHLAPRTVSRAARSRQPEPRRPRSRAGAGLVRRQLLLYALLLALAVFYLLPFAWSVSTSFKTLPESVQGFALLPHHPTLDGYREAFTTGPFGRYFVNSAIFAITSR